MIDLSEQRILVLAPHPDDEVIGCGGLISRAKRCGAKIFVMAMTVGDTAAQCDCMTPSYGPDRVTELRNVSAFLAVDDHEIVFPDGDRHLRLDQEPQRNLVDAIERSARLSLQATRPTMVLIPDPHSYNQDHRAVAAAAMTALRPMPFRARHQPATVLTYEQLVDHWTTGAVFAPRTYVELSSSDLAKKTAAMDLYVSQAREAPNPRSSDGLAALAAMRGMQAGVPLAEAFGCLRLFIREYSPER